MTRRDEAHELMTSYRLTYGQLAMIMNVSQARAWMLCQDKHTEKLYRVRYRNEERHNARNKAYYHRKKRALIGSSAHG